MIFVTVGAQMPFDRLIRCVDEWAGRAGRTDLFAQIGDTDLEPANIEFSKFLDPKEFNEKMRAASVVVAHAGMGSILTALQLEKPLLVMPRRGSLRETRNEHQVATAQRFLEMERLEVAFDEKELETKLDEIDSLKSREVIGPYAADELVETLRRFVEGEEEV